ncbi:hypothetical protein TNCV_2699651 [Trichonephila clavipes]|nr:hypothetical protein TNCV_2699651 [Trichonephila clavipes]
MTSDRSREAYIPDVSKIYVEEKKNIRAKNFSLKLCRIYCYLCHIRSRKFNAAKGQIFTPVVSLSFEHHAGDYGFAWFHPNYDGEYPGDGQGPPTSLSLLPASRETCSSTAI